jgi:hypothetical protein
MGKSLRFMADLISPLRVAPGSTVRLRRDHDPAYTGQVKRPEATARLAEGVDLLAEYQDRLAAQDTFGVLLVLQGLDASGKDSTIKHVMSGLNPQGVAVRAFKQPSTDDLNHDFLCRYQCALPGRGRIGIFNRSHYEEVLVVRVHPGLLAAERLPATAVKRDVWERRHREINDWERYLADNGVHIVKIMLNVSKRVLGRCASCALGRLATEEADWHGPSGGWPGGPTSGTAAGAFQAARSGLGLSSGQSPTWPEHSPAPGQVALPSYFLTFRNNPIIIVWRVRSITSTSL